ncbi:hypothetical protein [Fulvivirga sedimenti]|uniref:Uncharacterized protein n=1 Tax=Fulvivirga sedimenti TaxID=2879465 RepID=A0A9X1HVG8_9BACT|nr:hypothetical protein [Fulvivirga sedimenti]MCA6078690.1 hypothetical protein [Fulvivirga sedimenti]
MREDRQPWLEDQYKVALNHRVFAMNAMTFTGEEVLKGANGRFYIVDLTVPHDEYPNDKMGFNPARGANGFNFDKFLSEMKKNGMSSIPVLNGNLLYTDVEQDTLIPQGQLPWDTNGNRKNPMDYKAFSSFLYQFAARYGKNQFTEDGGTIDRNLIKVIDSNEKLAGLDLIEAIEPGNEMDRNWFTDKEEASPGDMAAFLSAAIDGHMGLMGPGHGIRNADPSMKIVFPGLIDIKEDYFLDVRDELLDLRKDAEKYGYPINPLTNFVINVHKYPEYGRIYRKLNDTKGRPQFEDTDIYEQSVRFVNEMREEFPDCDIWMTESGYDKMTAEEGRMGTPTAPGDSVTDMGISPKAQARQLARLSLSMYGSGFDRLYLFTLKDPKAIGAGYYKVQFSTSGLIRKNGQKDLAWYVVNGMRSKLSGYFLRNYEIVDGMHIMTFSKNGESDIQALWLASVTGASTEKMINGDNKGGMSVFALEKSEDPDWLSGETYEKNSIEVKVTEFPILVQL